jgi:hypothetical protein
MNKILMIICFLVLTCGTQANLNTTESFVVVGDETYFCNELHVGPGNFRITTVNGDVMKIASSKINAYSQQGYLYERLPVVNKNMDTADWAFMHFITSRDGYRLYRYCSNCNHYDPATGEIAPPTPVYRYYIFKDGKFITVTDDRNAKDLLMRFGVKLIS